MNARSPDTNASSPDLNAALPDTNASSPDMNASPPDTHLSITNTPYLLPIMNAACLPDRGTAFPVASRTASFVGVGSGVDLGDPEKARPPSSSSSVVLGEAGPDRPTDPAYPSLYDVPDGGLDAWFQVFGAWFVLAANWGLVNSFGVYQTYYESDLLSAHSSSDISWIGSLQGALLMTLGTVSGPLYDAGYFRQLIWAGLLLIVLGQFMVSLAGTYWQVLLAQGVCVGVGCGLTFLPATAVLSQYFRRRRALAFGIAATGSPVGGLVFPILFGKLQPVVGFAWATRAIAFVLLAVAVVPVVWMRMRVPPPGRKRSFIEWTAFREPVFSLFAAGAFFAFLGMYVVFFYIEVFAEHFAIGSHDFQPYFVSFLSAGSIVGRIGPSYCADKIGSPVVVTLATLACAVLCFVWIAVRDQGGLVAFTLLYGCFSGTVVSVSSTAVVSLSPDLGRVGTRLGMVFFLGGIAVLVGSPIAGAILADGNWSAVAGYTGGVLTLGMLLIGWCTWLSRK